jgi:glycosyltransferase involved in cell wall biosynthesis
MGLILIKKLAKEGLNRFFPEGTRVRRWLRRTKHTLRYSRFPSPSLVVSRWRKRVGGPPDIYTPGALSEFLAECGLPCISASPADAERDELGAARFVLALLRESAHLRRQFPRALGDGTTGSFCQWLCQEGAAQWRLTSRAVEHIRRAFARRVGARVRQLYEFRVDLRDIFPLALTPAGRWEFLRWLLLDAKKEMGYANEEICWFAQECAEDPSLGIVATYLMTPKWQEKVPHGLTRFGRAILLEWVRRYYRISGKWLDRSVHQDIIHHADELRLLYRARPDLRTFAPRAFTDDDDTRRLVEHVRATDHLGESWWQSCADPGALEQPGVNVLAHFCYPSGLQEAARSTVRGLNRVGVRTSCRDVPANLHCDSPNHADFLGLEVFDVTLLHLAPEPLVDVCYPLCGLARNPDAYRIAVWYWELEAVPLEWVRHARLIQEIWAPTRFIADAMRKVMPIPVVHMLGGAELKPFAPLPRSHFGLADDRFVFFFMFDMNSIMERKNPLGLIRAYQQAFGKNDRVDLVIKVTRGEVEPKNLERLQQAAEAAGATIINRTMSREESYALLNACDCYVSLHRSEGFGFTLAEAMLLGKPAIGTAYSGNLDFMTRDNSLLVDYRRIPITEDLPFYRKGCVWADPDIEQAAAHMRWVYEHRAEARALGERGRAEASQILSLDAAGQRMRRRLLELRTARTTTTGRQQAA